jgi:hypothetical protein
MPKAFLLALAATMLLLSPAASLAAPGSVNSLTGEALKGMLDDPRLLIIDVRIPHDWNSSNKKIKGARRQEPDKVAVWGKTLPPGKKIVLYCA